MQAIHSAAAETPSLAELKGLVEQLQTIRWDGQDLEQKYLYLMNSDTMDDLRTKMTILEMDINSYLPIFREKLGIEAYKNLAAVYASKRIADGTAPDWMLLFGQRRKLLNASVSTVLLCIDMCLNYLSADTGEKIVKLTGKEFSFNVRMAIFAVLQTLSTLSFLKNQYRLYSQGPMKPPEGEAGRTVHGGSPAFATNCVCVAMVIILIVLIFCLCTMKPLPRGSSKPANLMQ